MASRQGNNFGLDSDVEYCLSRVKYLTGVFYNFAIELQEIADYIIPRKNSILVERVPGWKRTQRLYDSTAPDSSEKLAASIHGTLTSPYIQWFSLETEDESLNAVPEVASWLQDSAARMRAQFNKSNFAQECHELYLDLVTFGTACLFFEEKPRDEAGFFGGFNFKSVNVGKFLLAEGPDGMVNSVFRTFPLSAAAILEKWPDLPKEGKELLTADPDKPDKVFSIIHGVYPARKGALDKEGNEKKWTSLYLMQKDRIKLSQDGFKEFPFMAPRWSKLSDETYGRGPSHTALPDVRSLNEIIKLELRSLAMRVSPPMCQTNGDVIGPIKLIPGGLTVVRGGKNSVFPLEMGGDFQVVNLQKQELKKSIQTIYYLDQLQLPQGPQMTAEEVVTRMELMERLLGPTVGRLESEFLRPAIDRGWAIMWRASQESPKENILPPLPQQLQDAMRQSKVALRIRFEGPLARAQKSADATAIQKVIQFIGTSVAPLKPDIADSFDFDDWMRKYASISGAPASGIVDPDKVAQMRAQRAQQQAQQAQAAQAQQAAQAAGQAAPLVKALHQAPEQGSVVGQLMNPNANNNGQQTGAS